MTKGDEIRRDVLQRVQLDVEEGFAGSLTPRSGARFAIGLNGSELGAELTVLTSDELVAVPWVYPCTHTGVFIDVPATHIDLDLRGVTFVDVRGAPGRWVYFRYIDYLGALHQIGVTTSARPVMNDDDYTNWANQSRRDRARSAPGRGRGRRR